VPFATIANLTFKMIAWEARFPGPFAEWAAELWQAKGPAPADVQAALEIEFPRFAAAVAENDSFVDLLCAFQFLGALHNAEMIDFGTVLLLMRFIEEYPRLEVRRVFAALAETTRIDPAEAVEIGHADPHVVAAIVDLVEPGVPQPSDDGRPVAVGIYVRDLVVEGFARFPDHGDAAAQARAVLLKCTLQSAMARDIVVAVFEAALAKCQLSERQAHAALSVLGQL
jgi:hypothetical protein